MLKLSILSLFLFASCSSSQQPVQTEGQRKIASLFGETVYLNENLEANTTNSSDSAYCVDWINASIMDYKASYAGVDGAEYSCNVSFRAIDINNDKKTSMGQRTIVYKSLPQQFRNNKKIGDLLAENYGVFSFPVKGPYGGPTAFDVALSVPNSLLHGIYATGNVLSEIFQEDPKNKMLKVVPTFDTLLAAQQAACLVASLELADNFCPNKQNVLLSDFKMRLKSLEARSSLIEKMYPKK